MNFGKLSRYILICCALALSGIVNIRLDANEAINDFDAWQSFLEKDAAPEAALAENAPVLAHAMLLSSGQVVTNGLELWLKADEGVISVDGKITYWNDMSGKGKNAPGYDEGPYLLENRLNGYPSIYFDGFTHISPYAYNDRLLINPTSQELFIVLKPGPYVRNDTFPIEFSGATNNYQWIRYPAEDGKIKSSFGLNKDRPYTFSADVTGWHTLNLSVNSALWEARLDGELKAAFSSPAYVPMKNVSYSIGGSVRTPWHGEIAEILVYSRKLNSTERQQVQSYLDEKYDVRNAPRVWNLPSPTLEAPEVSISSVSGFVIIKQSKYADTVELERSTDGVNFTPITKKSISSNLTNPYAPYNHKVDYIDVNVEEGVHYWYRIRHTLKGISSPWSAPKSIIHTSPVRDHSVWQNKLIYWISAEDLNAGILNTGYIPGRSDLGWFAQMNMTASPNSNAACETNSLNGLPSIHFPDPEDYYFASFSDNNNCDFETFLIIKSDEANSKFYDFVDSVAIDASGKIQGASNCSDMRDWRLYHVRYSMRAGSWEMISSVDGKMVKSTSQTGQKWLTNSIGGRREGWTGNIAEALIYQTRLSDADRAEIERYLANKYGLDDVLVKLVDTPGNPVAMVGENGVRLSWGGGNNGNAVQYIVERREKNGVWEVIATINGLNYIDATAETGKEYEYRIKGVLGDYGSEYSQPIEVRLVRENTVPAALAQKVSLIKDKAQEIVLVAYDADGDSLSFSIVDSPENGILSGVVPELTYTPNAGFTGEDHFTFKVNDGIVDSEVAVVGLSVYPSDNDQSTTRLVITSPAANTSLTSAIEVKGSALDPNFASYEVQSRLIPETGGAPKAWTTFARDIRRVGVGATPGVLGTIDPSILRNGVHEIRVIINKTNSSVIESNYVRVIIEGERKIGPFSISFKDLSEALAGIPLEIVRSYDSRDRATDGDFGYGWNLNINTVSLRKNTPINTGWQQVESAGWIKSYTLQASARHLMTVSFVDGTVATFESTPMMQGTYPYPLYSYGLTMGFNPVNNRVKGTLAVEGSSQFYVNGGDYGGTTAVTLVTQQFGNQPYNPTRFRYTAPDGAVSVIDEKIGLISFTDKQGNKLTVIRDAQNKITGLTHSSGQGLVINRDPGTKRITGITDPYSNTIRYAYDTNGDLVSVIDRSEAETKFAYYTGSPDPRQAHLGHFLKDIVNANGITTIRNEYDEEGRLIRQTDALGNPVDFVHDIVGETEWITDRLGYASAHKYDSLGNVTHSIRADGSITSYTFTDAFNPNSPTSETDPLGRTTTYKYDSYGRVTKETNHLGESTETAYNAYGSPTQIKDARGYITKLDYKGNGLLDKVTDSEGKITKFDSYDSRGNITQVTDAQGGVTKRTYDSNDRLVTETKSDGVLLTYEYDSNGYISKETYSKNGSVWVTAYLKDKEDRILQTTHPDGNITATEYDKVGNPVKSIDSAGRVSTVEYDAAGNVIKTVYYPASQVKGEKPCAEENIYDAEGRVTHSKDRSGVWTRSYYDPVGRIIARFILGKMERNLAAATSIGYGIPQQYSQYDAAGQLTDSYDASGYRTHYDYDGAGRKTQVTPSGNDPSAISLNADGDGLQIIHGANSLNLSRVSENKYDLSGNLIEFIDPSGNSTRYEYDKCDRLVKTIFPDNSTNSQSYDALGRRSTSTDAEGKTTSYTYHANGQIETIVDAAGNTTRYGYDDLGRRNKQIDAEGRTTHYTYYGNGQRATRTLPEGQSETLVYDSEGKLLSHTHFNGEITVYEYDGFGNLSKTTPSAAAMSRGALSAAFTYDAYGRRSSQQLRNSAETLVWWENYGYDDLGRLVKKFSKAGNIEYSYDAIDGNLISIRTNNGTEAYYAYDSENRLLDVQDRNMGTTEYAYDANGNMASVRLPNGVASAYAYDTLNRLTDITAAKGVNNVAAFSYGLRPSGHRSSLQETINGAARNHEYSYDALCRLTQEKINGTDTIDYHYDKVGNRKTRTVNGVTHLNTVSSYVYDGNDRLLSADATAYTYDANGNTLNGNIGGVGLSPLTGSPLAAKTTTDSYDHNNKLVSRSGGTGNVTIVYDADGNWVAKTANDLTTYYLVDTLNPTGYAQVIEEITVYSWGNPLMNGTVSKRYVYGHDLISQEVRQTAGDYKTSYYGYDGLGSVRYLTDEDGSITDRYTYDAFGTLIDRWNSGTATDNCYLFAGEQYDADLGLYFNRARYLDTNTGRFWSMDSFEGNSQDPLSLHKYLYAHNNPANIIDPSGNFGVFGMYMSYTSMIGNLVLQTMEFARGIAGGLTLTQAMANSEASFKEGLVWEAAPYLLGAIGTGIKFAWNAAKFLKTINQTSNIVYRALSLADIQALKAGKGLLAKSPNGSWTAAEHIANEGRIMVGGAAKNSPWISTTRLLEVAKAYDGGYGIVKIDLNKIVHSKQVEVWREIYSLTGKQGVIYNRSFWAQEVTVFQSIPTSAILGFVN